MICNLYEMRGDGDTNVWNGGEWGGVGWGGKGNTVPYTVCTFTVEIVNLNLKLLDWRDMIRKLHDNVETLPGDTPDKNQVAKNNKYPKNHTSIFLYHVRI